VWLGRNSAFPPTPEEKLREEDRQQLEEGMVVCEKTTSGVVDAAEKNTTIPKEDLSSGGGAEFDFLLWSVTMF
jgi:hypothetical protein